MNFEEECNKAEEFALYWCIAVPRINAQRERYSDDSRESTGMRIAELLFRAKVLGFLTPDGLLGEERIELLLSWLPLAQQWHAIDWRAANREVRRLREPSRVPRGSGSPWVLRPST